MFFIFRSLLSDIYHALQERSAQRFAIEKCSWHIDFVVACNVGLCPVHGIPDAVVVVVPLAGCRHGVGGYEQRRVQDAAQWNIAESLDTR